jgi:hypothetical protein
MDEKALVVLERIAAAVEFLAIQQGHVPTPAAVGYTDPSRAGRDPEFLEAQPSTALASEQSAKTAEANTENGV